MADFITLITSVLDIEFTIGLTTISLGAVAIATIVLGAGVAFFKSVRSRR